ncbi:MAG TPA: GAF domain-containing protein, partial [Sphingomicrobium sp.]|nr:GAF domain-containing protein [Sphingomicrobium sp.]
LELSLDWLVLRASENIHQLIGESHVTLIDEPLGRFVHSQALHDLRNLFSRLSATTGIGRAYGIRLTDDPDLVDVAFQLSHGRVLLELVPSTGTFGEHLGSVAGLIAGLAGHRGRDLLEAGSRRMRALTGYDRVTLAIGGERTESSRGAFAGPAAFDLELPQMVADAQRSGGIGLFPRRAQDSSVGDALLRACGDEELAQLGREGVRAVLRVPVRFGDVTGEFRCDSRSPRQPGLELHAAAELFAQMFAMRLELDAAS